MPQPIEVRQAWKTIHTHNADIARSRIAALEANPERNQFQDKQLATFKGSLKELELMLANDYADV